jgi:GAF domain-containing protein
MVDHDLLHRELSTFASSLTGEFDLIEALQQITVTAAAALDVDGAGVTLRMPEGETQYIYATDPVTLHVEQQQVVAVNDLTDDPRWPRFTPVLLEAGFQSAAGVPIRFQGQNLGAVNLYASSSRAWTVEEFTAGQVVADLAAGYLVSSRLRRDAEALAEQLQQALDSRILIEQAKGLLAGRHGMEPDAAFEVLRGYARNNRSKLHDVARAVVTDKLDPMGAAAEASWSESGGDA